MDSVLITGVAGFLGRYVARHFSKQGWSVMGMDCASPENAPLANLNSYHRLTLPDPRFHDLLKANPQACIHCAGRASVPLSIIDPASDYADSTILTFEILNALRVAAPECRFIMLSSAAVYGNPSTIPVSEDQSPSPLSPYGFHKWQCEILCREFSKVYGLPCLSTRIFSAYGAGLRRQVVWDICQKALNSKHFYLQGTGRESRDFIHAADVARALEILAKMAPFQGETYNLATGREVPIEELSGLIVEHLGVGSQPEFDGEVPVGTPRRWCADISKLASFGFSPHVSFEAGIKSFVDWCRSELSSL